VPNKLAGPFSHSTTAWLRALVGPLTELFSEL
jgi:hypothetical protein